MTKQELIQALANVSDDTPIVFGTYQPNAIAAIPDMVIHSDYWEEVIITNQFCHNDDWLENEHKILFEDFEED